MSIHKIPSNTSKLEVGDRIQVINYGHMLWQTISEDKLEFKLISEDERFRYYDMKPALVGLKGYITGISEPQPNYIQYKVHLDDFGSLAWLGNKQIKLLKKRAIED